MFSHARRWERLGVWKTAAINQVCVAAYYLGVSPSRIQGWYDGGKGGLRGGNSGGREEKLKNRKILPLLGGLVLVAGAGVWFLARTTQPRMLRFAAGGRFSGGAFSYAEYATVLRTHVDGQGMVNYEGLLADRPMLDTFAAVLGQLDPSLYEQWSAEAQIAFWINAYNALALETILNHYPIRPSFLRSLAYPRNSIQQIPGVFDQLQFPLLGRPMTLDGIEHEVLRKQFREPRIHVALVCAAMGYPPLRNEPFEGAKLEEQLADQTRRFLANPRKFRIDRSQRRVYLSAIFDWYGEDFVPLFGTEERFGGHGAAERAVMHFISRHLGEADRAYLERETYALEYLDYDWSLNEQAPAGEGS